MEQKISHSDMVKTLAKSGEDILAELSPDQVHNWHMATGVSGEAGELLDAVKKYAIYQKPIDHENVVEELGDLEFYMEGLRQGFGITREETLDHNINKLAKRYEGFKYTNEAAHARADKQVEEVADADGWFNNTGIAPNLQRVHLKFADGEVMHDVRPSTMRWSMEPHEGAIDDVIVKWKRS